MVEEAVSDEDEDEDEDEEGVGDGYEKGELEKEEEGGRWDGVVDEKASLRRLDVDVGSGEGKELESRDGRSTGGGREVDLR